MTDEQVHEAFEDIETVPIDFIMESTDDYRQAFGDVPIEETFSDEGIDGIYRHYVGKNGDYIYDSRFFQLQYAELESGDRFEVLRYIGTETDGSKIPMPEGYVEDVSMMFMGTDIRSTPKLPDTARKGVATFANCHNLTDAQYGPGPNMTKASYMFACCDKLARTSFVVGGVTKDVDYMFANCESLRKAPRFGEGITSMNGTLMNCKKLEETPIIPSTVKQSRYTTAECDTLDKMKDAAQKEAVAKARQKYEHSLTKKSLGERVGSMFSAALQAYSLGKMGYGFVASALMTGAMRKEGMFGTDLRSGIAALAMTKGGVIGGAVYRHAQKSAMEAKAKKEEEVHQKMAEWDAIYGSGTAFNKAMEKSRGNADKDVKRGLYQRLNSMETSQLDVFRETHGHASIYEAQANLIRAQTGGVLDEGTRKGVAEWFKQEFEHQAAYLKQAELAINVRYPKNVNRVEYNKAMSGLDTMKSITMEPLAETILELHRGYGLFNDGDKRDLDKLMEEITGHKLFDNADQPLYAAQSFSFMRNPDDPLEQPDVHSVQNSSATHAPTTGADTEQEKPSYTNKSVYLNRIADKFIQPHKKGDKDFIVVSIPADDGVFRFYLPENANRPRTSQALNKERKPIPHMSNVYLGRDNGFLYDGVYTNKKTGEKKTGKFTAPEIQEMFNAARKAAQTRRREAANKAAEAGKEETVTEPVAPEVQTMSWSEKPDTDRGAGVKPEAATTASSSASTSIAAESEVAAPGSEGSGEATSKKVTPPDVQAPMFSAVPVTSEEAPVRPLPETPDAHGGSNLDDEFAK